MTLPRYVTIFEGRRGQPGTDGADGLGSENLRGGLINNPLSSILRDKNESQVLNGALSVSRVTEATFPDRYGLIGSPAFLENTNLFTYSFDLTQWFLTNLVLESSTEADPFGGNTATRFSCPNTSAKGFQLTTTIEKEKYYTVSFWIKSVTGSIDALELFGNFGFSRTITATITNEYQRIEAYFVGADATEVGIQVFADVDTEFIVTGMMLQEGTNATEYIPTDGSQETVESLGSILRNNENGFLIEGPSENLLVYTENFVTQWSVTGGTLTEYSGVDPFGNENRKTNVKSLNSETTDLINIADVSYQSGLTYTVSFYGVILAGSVSAVLVSIGGGEFQPFDTLPTSGFERRSVQVVAGDQNNELVFRIVSVVSNADVVFTGVQAELGDRLTSYIRSSAIPLSRSADLISVDSDQNIPSPSQDFSFLCNINDYEPDNDLFYIFDNGETGVDNFSCWLDNENLYIRNALETISFDWSNTNTKLAITNDGGLISVYADGLLVSSQSFVGSLVGLSTRMNYFSDLNGENNFYGYASSLEWFLDTKNADEIKYLHGSSV